MRMKRISIVASLSAMMIIAAIGSLNSKVNAYGNDPPHCYGYDQCYNIGNPDGKIAAYEDYWNYNPYNLSCPSDEPHSKGWCNGYLDGYYTEWKYLAWHGPRFADKVQQLESKTSQSSDVNIKGNNDRVVVNQQASQNVPGDPIHYSDGGGHRSSSGSQSNPKCLILCANIRVN